MTVPHCRPATFFRAPDTQHYYLCVLCVFVPSILAAVPSIKARRALHFAVFLEDYTFSVNYSVQQEPTGVTQEGVNTCTVHQKLFQAYNSMDIKNGGFVLMPWLVGSKMQYNTLVKQTLTVQSYQTPTKYQNTTHYVPAVQKHPRSHYTCHR